MFTRAACRAETTLLSSGPRAGRRYSTPTKQVNAQMLATARAGPSLGPAVYGGGMEGYLKVRMPYTLLPSMRPMDSQSPVNMEWYGDTETQDRLAIMDACLHDLYDVPRAEAIFRHLRLSRAKTLLEPRMFNAFLEAFLGMAAREPHSAEAWYAKLWQMYLYLEENHEGQAPTYSTYAIMLVSMARVPADLRPLCPITYADLLKKIVERKLDVRRIIADRALKDSDDAALLLQELSRAAVQLGHSVIVAELGQTETMGTLRPDILDTIPEVMPVLKRVVNKAEDGTEDVTTEIPFNIDALRRHLSQINFARRVLPDDITARQKLLEESVYDVAKERLEHESNMLDELGITSPYGKDIRQWMWEWHSELHPRLHAEITKITEAEERTTRRRANLLAPYLLLVSSQRLSLITILEIMRLHGSGGVHEGMKTTRALIALGKAVEMEYKAQMYKKNNITLPALRQTGNHGYFSGLGYKNLLERRVAAARHISDNEAWSSNWTQTTRSQIGGILIDCLMQVATVTRTGIDKKSGDIVSEQQPAFYHAYEHTRGQKLGVIRLNPTLAEAMARDNIKSTLHPRHLPMLVPPRSWVSPDRGGYFYNKSTAMRYKESVEQASYLKSASDAGSIELIYAGLDVLGSTPWVINKQIFEVVLEVWNSGKGLGKLPPAVFDGPEPVLSLDPTPKERAQYMTELRQYNQEKGNNHSKRCSVNYKIEIARSFLGDRIFQPHNLDFRGRAYPIPPHLNHIGDDLSRGLLKFADAKPLGVRGLRWLKIHIANLYGFDKANFDEREQFAEDHRDDIFDSALNPLTGRGWWMHADDPWQCLATCFELHDALTSPDPIAFLSSQPVHQDGTCNGLQHYAALGGDSRGAQQVNLAAGDRPSDVYTYVANMVEAQILADKARGEPNAVILSGKISRKMVKQTVMTTVYGVTYVGARDQIEKQIRLSEAFRREDAWQLSAYLAKQVLGCIGDLFSGAKDIQNWLTLCARLVSRAIPEVRLPEALYEYNMSSTKGKGQASHLPAERLKKELLTSVVWTTPLGLPIVQPYRKTKRKQVMTKVQTVYISDPNAMTEVNSMKQSSAFPPNFIHSLDATHMMLSALECQTQELTFAAVHDSYWTHACSIDAMSVIIRDTFIALHSSDVLGKLREEFVERYAGYKIPLYNLRGPSIVKALKDSGVSLKVSGEQAKEMTDLAPILSVSKDGEKVDVVDVGISDEEKAEVIKMSGGELTEGDGEEEDVDVDMEAEEEAEEEEDMEEDEDEEGVPKKRKSRRKTGPKKHSELGLLGKFVTLTDILPPVPKKGDFRVEAIKASQYFFS